MLAFSSKLFKESVHAIIMRLKSKSLQSCYAQPGRKLSIADNNTVCESCDSYGHFARDCPHCKPNAVAAQNKRDAIWAEKNSVQASELQEMNKLIKEAERLRAMADTAGIAYGSTLRLAVYRESILRVIYPILLLTHIPVRFCFFCLVYCKYKQCTTMPLCLSFCVSPRLVLLTVLNHCITSFHSHLFDRLLHFVLLNDCGQTHTSCNHCT